MSNDDKVIYIPHDKEDESKGGIWMPLEQWNLWKETVEKFEQAIFKNLWNLKLNNND